LPRISTDTRGRLQSHGISGVQARHYDGHDCIKEKREAPDTLFGLLESSSGKVIQLPARLPRCAAWLSQP